MTASPHDRLPPATRALLVRWTAELEFVPSAELATELLLAGHEDDDLCVASTLSGEEAEAHGLVSGALERLGLSVPKTDCILELARNVARDITAGTLDVEEGAPAIWRLACHDSTFPDAAWHGDASSLLGYLDDLEGVRRNFGGSRSAAEVERVVEQQRARMREIAVKLLQRSAAGSA